MSYDWGPRYIIPSKVIETYSGNVVLREELDEDLLGRELASLGILGPIVNITSPWYYRRKDTDTWIKIGESSDGKENFAVPWDTTEFENGKHQVLGLMHVLVKNGDQELTVSRQNIIDVTVEN